MKNLKYNLIAISLIGLLFLTGCENQNNNNQDILFGGRTSNFWKTVSNKYQTITDKAVNITGDLEFQDEIKPDGVLCSNGQILKKTGADNWDCASDLSGGGAGGSGLWATTTNEMVVYPVDTTDIVVIGANATSTTGNIFEISGNSLFDDIIMANASSTQQTISDKLWVGDDVYLSTGGKSAIIKADNIATSDKTFQFPNNSGLFITTGDIDTLNDTVINWGTGANQVNSDDIPDHDGHTVKDTFTHSLNRGKAEEITITETGGLGISWIAGELYDGNTDTFFTTDAGSGNLTNTAVNYLKWVSGTGLTISTTAVSGDEILVATLSVYDEIINGYRETALMNKTIGDTRRGLRALFPNRVINGMSVYEDTDATNPLDVTMDAGVFWKEAIEKKTPTEVKSRNTAMVRHFHTSGVWDSDINAEIETTNYDNGTDLTAITANKYVKGLFIFMNGKIGFVYPTAFYNTIAQAETASLPAIPTGLEAVPKLTAVIYQQGDTDFTTAIWQDVRAGISEESFSGVTDHGALTGLGDDDHPQYGQLVDNETITGNWINTDNPWADNEVSNTLTVSGYMQDTDIDTFAELQNWAVGYTDNNTTYTGGTNLTLNGTQFDVDDAFLINTGDVGTGIYDFGGATSFEIVNATAPTVDATGECAIDTTDGTLICYDGSNAVVMGDDIYQTNFTIYADADWDNEEVPIWISPKDYAITIVQVSTACMGTTPVLTYNIEERAKTGLASAGTDIYASDQTADADGEDETSFSNAGIAAGAHLVFTTGTTAESGTVDLIQGVIYYRKNIE